MERLMFSTEVLPTSEPQLYYSRRRQPSRQISVNLSYRYRSQRFILIPSRDVEIFLGESVSPSPAPSVNFKCYAHYFLSAPRHQVYRMLASKLGRWAIDFRRHRTLIPAIANSITHQITIGQLNNRMILPLSIQVEIIDQTFFHGVEVESDRALLLSESGLDMEARNNNNEMVPTAREARLLKCVRVEKGETCSICLDEIEEFGASMPCNHHKFHAICIEKWLKVSHYCPVCRFEMPTLST